MNIPILTAGLLLGLDSLVVCFAIGLSHGGRRLRWLPLAFAVCDGLAWWVGTALGPVPWAILGGSWIGPAAVAGYGLYVFVVVRSADRRAAAGATWLVFAVPALLSLDNLVAGTAHPGPLGFPAVASVGVMSGLLAAGGLAAGTALATRVGPRAGWLGGAALLAVAAYLTIKDGLS